jgi:hypothetical protein
MSCTGAKSQVQPVAASALPVTSPAARAAAGSQVAPTPIDCGNSGAWNGCPKPCTASTPSSTGMCSRVSWTATRWIALAQSAQPLPVLSAGLSVPPARIEPVKFFTSTLFRQFGCSGSVLPPALPQSPLAGLVESRSSPVTIWSIWPTFSASVIRRSRSSTRADTGAFRFRYSGPALTGGAAPAGPEAATRASTQPAAAANAMTGLIRAAPGRAALRR